MKGKKVKPFSIILIIAMILNLYMPISAVEFDKTESDWAKPELSEALEYKLTYPGIMKNFNLNITREEFCILAVRLYEQLTAEKAVAGKNPFADTENPEILKAFSLGIVKGISSELFAPDNNITRQEICVMIYRALKVSISNLDADISGDFPFDDSGIIASWALNEMKFAYKNNIMKGIGNNNIGPLQNTTREQAVVLMKRTYESFSNNPETEITEPSDTADEPVISFNPPKFRLSGEKEKYTKLAEKNMLFTKYDNRLQLYVSTGSLKPLKKPVASTFQLSTLPILQNILTSNDSVYTDSSWSAFIDKKNPVRWFSYSLENASGAQKILWQVSTAPFSGGSPVSGGLVASGEISAAAGEFSIDFSNLKISTYSNSLQLIKPALITSAYKPVQQLRKPYYVRAFPADSSGNPIGDPGKGIAVIYGEPSLQKNPEEIISSSFQLWTPRSTNGKFYGENIDLPVYKPVIRISPMDKENRMFHFHNLDDNYNKIGIQVSTEAFPASGGEWPDTPNIIHSQLHQLPVEAASDDFPDILYVDFTSFAPGTSEMKEGEYIKYYIRGIALKDSSEPGIIDADYSEPVTVEYGYSPPVKWYSDSPYKKTEKINASLPNIKLKRYNPVKWQDTDYLHHYYVFQAPKASEITCRWKNADTGEILYPYYLYIPYYKSKGIDSPQEYEAQIIPKVLPVGAKVYFPPPKEEDKSWYRQLYEGIVGFFEDLTAVVKELTNQVSSAYSNLKTGLITYVAELCPVESLKGPFKTALEGMVNAGLMSLGIPPELPNFDQLTDMSLDYMAEVALTEAGIPANEITEELVKDISESMAEEFEKATSYADSNPINSPFLKLDPDYLYRPAYVDLELNNDTSVNSISGSFDINVNFEMGYYDITDGQYGLFLSTPTNYSYNSSAGLTATTAYRNHFQYGLNGYSVEYTQGDKAVYDVFSPKQGIKIPSLYPGETRNVRVYLNPMDSSRFSRYPEGEHILQVDFENMYFNNGSKKFTYFNLRSHFPDARKYLQEQGNIVYLDPEINYVYDNQNYHAGSARIQKPVDKEWTNN